MAECECLNGCPFYNDKMNMDRGMGKIYKDRYCLGDHTQCARYVVFKKLGKAKVPANLFPNMADRVDAIIAAG